MFGRSKKIRYAVVGLGHFAQAAILPAFANAKKNSVLAALVTGDERKASELGAKYAVPCYSYAQLEECLAKEQIQAVYLAVPNAKHREFAVRAASAGVHVLCEKPLAATVEDCEAMIDACARADVRLMTAYRLHFEAGNLNAIEAVTSGKIGEPRLFNALHTMQVDGDNFRVDADLGGGPLEDIGVYCINAARYLFRAEPEEVSAVATWGHDARFHEVPEAVSATLRFPGNRLASFQCGFREAKATQYVIIGTKGKLAMDPAFTWHEDIRQTLSVDGEKETKKKFAHRDQVAAELLYFSNCVRDNKQPEPSGHEGLLDVRIIDALRSSYNKGMPVPVERDEKEERPTSEQSIERPPSSEPALVNAAPPTH